MYLGIHARVLAVLRDPGPKAGGVKGSGFLSVENDDPTAERQLRFITEAGLDPAEVVPWNAYPWYINKKPNADQLRDGTEPLRQVIGLLPELQVILLLGGTAQQTWSYFTKTHTGLVEECGITVVQTYHPSRQALQHPDVAVREAREEHLRQSFRTAGTIVRGGAGGTNDQPLDRS
jgi:uracil-DNA glycosylase